MKTYVNLSQMAISAGLNLFESRLELHFNGGVDFSDVLILSKMYQGFSLKSTSNGLFMVFKRKEQLLTPRTRKDLYVIPFEDVFISFGVWYMSYEKFKATPLFKDFNYKPFLCTNVA